jgi:hypothetical protein
MRDNLFAIQIPDWHFQSLLDGRINSWHVHGMKTKYCVGDDLVFIEFDTEQNCEKDRRYYGKVSFSFNGPEVGLPEGCCFFGFHSVRQEDFIRDYDLISNKILPEYESKLGWKLADTLTHRIASVLSSFDSIASNSVLQAKGFVEDCKTQFKALEIVLEGVTSEALNHGQKRVIANHVITMLRGMVDRIDQISWDYSTRNFERYNYFRSQSPERTLMEKYRDMKRELEILKEELKSKGTPTEELPF